MTAAWRTTAAAVDRADERRLVEAIVAAFEQRGGERSRSRTRVCRDLEGVLSTHRTTAEAARTYQSAPSDDAWKALVAAVRRRLEAPVQAPTTAKEKEGTVGPDFAAELCEALDWPRPFSLVQRDELRAVDELRRRRGVEPTAPLEDDTAGLLERAHERRLVGLAFSGGGIRSATFNLGVLQALASLGMLERFDYLSTVSGGGYVGSWLVSWIRRAGFGAVKAALVPEVAPTDEAPSTRPIGFLREYSNYLTPRLGLFSADSWTLVAVYVRNVLLNLATLVAGLAAVLLVPRLALLDAFRPGTAALDVAKVLLAATLLLVALGLVAACLRQATAHWKPEERRRAPRFTRQGIIQAFAVGPVLASCYLFAKPLWRVATHDASGAPWTTFDWWAYAIGFGLFAAVCSLVVQVFGGFRDCYVARRPGRAWGLVPQMLLIAGLSGVAAAGLLRLLLEAAAALAGLGAAGLIHFWVFGPPAMLAVIGLTTILGIGLMGLDFPDAGREWCSRFGAWLAIYALVWFALFGATVYGPLFVAKAVDLTLALPAGLIVGWIATTISSVLAARSPATGRDVDGAKRRSRTLELVAHVGPPVFATGFVVLVGLATDLLLVKPWLDREGLGAYWASGGANHWRYLENTTYWPANLADFTNWPFGFVVPLLIVLVAVTLVLSWRVDINEFSMHHFYKNRLVRCFLGASRPERRPNPFTGFDDEDDGALADVAPDAPPRGADALPYVGPYPIVNAALNYTAGAQLAWQERKAASFVFTPLYCGFETTPANGAARREPSAGPRLRSFGFRPTRRYAYAPSGIGLGTAVAISGAAVSPNQGYHTSPAVAFLLTVFDVRLGWWLGNPRNDRTWRKSSPGLGLVYLTRELFGLSDDRSGFVSVSDGGHFENLGIYELVRRRCAVIVACDAEQDEGLTFDGLAGAVRKCRTDFGVEIDLDPSRIARVSGTARSRTHCVVGTIRYPEAPDRPGLLVYVKSSLTGEEPADVLEYAADHAGFPHESTADQWFDESQFESYRRLGLHVATATFAPAKALFETMDDRYEDVFRAAERMWYPPSAAIEASATKHTRTYAELLDTLRADDRLRFLDRQLFPQSGLPIIEPTPECRREAFYFCTALIQLLEDIWTDFRLEEDGQLGSPYVEGWLSLYRGWIGGSPAMKATWVGVQSTYGARFQAFWKRLERESATGTSGNGAGPS